MKQILAHLPNFITILNGVCGSWMIYFAITRQYELVIILGLCALFFDFLDGFVARLLKQTSEIGAILDSLCDGISFALGAAILSIIVGPITDLPILIMYAGSTVLLASGIWRLAVFASGKDQNLSFKGLPTPATFLYYLGLLWYQLNTGIDIPQIVWIVSPFIFSYLMISKHKMLNFKGLKFQLQGNYLRLLLVVLATLLLFITPHLTLSGIVVCYILVSFIPENN